MVAALKTAPSKATTKASSKAHAATGVTPDPSPTASVAAKRAWIAETLKSIREDTEKLSINADMIMSRLS